MNLIEGIQTQCNRCRKLLAHYEAIGPVGQFGFIMISQDIQEGEDAVASGDVIRMLAAYKALEECK